MRKRRIPIVDLVFVIIFTLLYWKPFLFNISTSFSVAIPMEKKSFGIDVSHHQGEINWDTLLSSKEISPTIDFVFVKATEGLEHIDKNYKLNTEALNKYNIPVGAYHFFIPSKNSTQQVKHFISAIKSDELSLPPVLDVEHHGKSTIALQDSVQVFLDLTEDLTGKRPIIYCSWNFYEKYFHQDFNDYKFWVARYSNSISFKDYPNILYWQFTDKADLPFHKSKIDLNVSSVRID